MARLRNLGTAISEGGTIGKLRGDNYMAQRVGIAYLVVSPLYYPEQPIAHKVWACIQQPEHAEKYLALVVDGYIVLARFCMYQSQPAYLFPVLVGIAARERHNGVTARVKVTDRGKPAKAIPPMGVDFGAVVSAGQFRFYEVEIGSGIPGQVVPISRLDADAAQHAVTEIKPIDGTAHRGVCPEDDVIYLPFDGGQSYPVYHLLAVHAHMYAPLQLYPDICNAGIRYAGQAKVGRQYLCRAVAI